MKVSRYKFVVIGFYSDGTFEYICRCNDLEQARFEAAYQCRFFNEVNIEKGDKIVAKYRNIHGNIEEVEL